MAFFDNIGRKVSEAGQKMIQKTGEMSDTSRLNAQINDEERLPRTDSENQGRSLLPEVRSGSERVECILCALRRADAGGKTRCLR